MLYLSPEMLTAYMGCLRGSTRHIAPFQNDQWKAWEICVLEKAGVFRTSILNLPVLTFSKTGAFYFTILLESSQTHISLLDFQALTSKGNVDKVAFCPKGIIDIISHLSSKVVFPLYHLLSIDNVTIHY